MRLDVLLARRLRAFARRVNLVSHCHRRTRLNAILRRRQQTREQYARMGLFLMGLPAHLAIRRAAPARDLLRTTVSSARRVNTDSTPRVSLRTAAVSAKLALPPGTASSQIITRKSARRVRRSALHAASRHSRLQARLIRFSARPACQASSLAMARASQAAPLARLLTPRTTQPAQLVTPHVGLA